MSENPGQNDQVDADIDLATDSELKQRREHAMAELQRFFDEEETIESRRQRERFCKRCGTSWANMKQIMRGDRSIAPWLAINLDRESGGKLKMEELCVEVDPRHKIDWDYVRKALRRKPTKA